ncbi:malic acid transport [Fusarium albosuccineum]|uniref:Sulfite efflux pump SSU1 n=1 Tax=Fusarium albosuccineum TaxID=1237068 RepID=A0A8H4L2B5_9HYPO|nr:malic acid transport [Fusarium albosuccineum]
MTSLHNPDPDPSQIAYPGSETVANGTSSSSPDDLERDDYSVNQRGWRRIVLNFTPAWFTVNMGTGITSILLHNLPYNGRWLYWISIIIFCLNIFLFLSFLSISILRYSMFRGVFSETLRTPSQAVYLGTIPMGLATIINMIVFVCVPAWGDRAAVLAWALWWIDAVIAMACNFCVPHAIMRTRDVSLSSMNASWLLPIVADIVASATGAIVANVLPNHQHAIWTVIFSYILWGTGVPMALVILAMYYNRLMFHDVPPKEVIVSCFIPLGPLGQGAAGIQLLGQVALKLFSENDFIPRAPIAGQFFYVAGIMLALIMWGFGLVWMFFALATIYRRKFPFNLSWWAFTFPLGVYTVATTTLAQELPSLFFKVLGTIFSVIETCLWMMVALGTIKYALNGRLFKPPPTASWAEKNKVYPDQDSPA